MIDFLKKASQHFVLLSAVYVIGPGDKGILLEHRESLFGDIVNEETLLNAIAEIGKETKVEAMPKTFKWTDEQRNLIFRCIE